MSTTMKDPSNRRTLRRPALDRRTAMTLAADPTATDPVCRHAPARPAVDHILEQQAPSVSPFIYRGSKR